MNNKVKKHIIIEIIKAIDEWIRTGNLKNFLNIENDALWKCVFCCHSDRSKSKVEPRYMSRKEFKCAFGKHFTMIN